MANTTHIETNGAWNYTKRTATALDEVGIMEVMGRDSWELIGFGPFYLEFRQPDSSDLAMQWEYHRYTGMNHSKERSERLREGWEPAGQWGPFLYFKRPLARE